MRVAMELLITIVGLIAFLLSLLAILFKRGVDAGTGKQEVDIYGKVRLKVNSAIMLLIIAGIVALLPLYLECLNGLGSELKLVISGQVVRGDSKEGIPGARVLVEEDKTAIKEMTTDQQGFFGATINVELDKDYTIKASKEGYTEYDYHLLVGLRQVPLILSEREE